MFGKQGVASRNGRRVAFLVVPFAARCQLILVIGWLVDVLV